MAWWMWLLIGWVIVATVLTLWLGLAAQRIKYMERLDAHRRGYEQHPGTARRAYGRSSASPQ